MAADFEAAVEDGLRLSKRIYFGKDRAVAPPKPHTAMERAAGCSYLPNSPMLYAVITDPAVVDNPDMPSYQPHVHGRCTPPALIPLQMNGVLLEVDCYLDTAFVTVTGTWRVHCVMGSRSCDCRIAVPMGEQGSILGVEVEVPRKSYSTEFISVDNEKGPENVGKTEGAGFLKAHIFTLTVPQVDGGTNISVKLRWSQKLLYHDGQFTLRIPFSFPEYVTPAAKKISKREKIELNVNAGPETEILCKTTSHPLKERLRQAGKLGFLYDSEVLSWSSNDFMFSYTVSTSHTFGSVLLNPPLAGDVDRRDMFYCYLYPGKQESAKVFRKEVVFVVDMSGSMRGQPLEDTKTALFSGLAKLGPKDLFNVIAFNDETCMFSSILEPATADNIENVNKWVNSNFVASGGTNILLPLNQAIKILSDNPDSIPIIFLITDGAAEDEKNICGYREKQLRNYKNMSPRICTLGIGKFCNHYFLRMLAMTSRGHHDAASDAESIEARLEGLFSRASSIFLADIAFQNLDGLDDLEVFPCQIPDLSSESPLVVSGRYRGTFPETLKVNGCLGDMTSFTLDLKVEEAKEIPTAKMAAKHQIELLTAQAWFSNSQELEKKIAKMSELNTVVSEYTNMVLLEIQRGKANTDTKKSSRKGDAHQKEEPKPKVISTMHNIGLGYGSLSATAENIPSGYGDPDDPDGAEVFTKSGCGCCGRCWRHCCCMCCIQVCSRMNDQCAIVFTQLVSALACLGCYSCCSACCGGEEG
ncbi:LOW QUALITY PROTEIN: uncharacterized protein LOC130987726 [Salvia miltiorrhiza]|uniref:LOW QUALITY PROTEIN: uncharacterized protein LOC130987726 n=1 Tax=Salvia miltiorrhiza TaxID=226208 RepID=UPI0025ACBF83|nr:LOW QUALITY PROTEIN: uncharacterized protein LOC130987726 [Salvia miltiorrhiza]